MIGETKGNYPHNNHNSNEHIEFQVGENDLRIIIKVFVKVDKNKCRDKCWNIDDTASNGLKFKGLILQLNQVLFVTKSEMKI